MVVEGKTGVTVVAGISEVRVRPAGVSDGGRAVVAGTVVVTTAANLEKDATGRAG